MKSSCVRGGVFLGLFEFLKTMFVQILLILPEGLSRQRSTGSFSEAH